MSTRYGHGGHPRGSQDHAERKDEHWRSRQGGEQSRTPGRRSESEASSSRSRTEPPPGTNTQHRLAGIGQASERSLERLEDDGMDVRRGEVPESGDLAARSR